MNEKYIKQLYDFIGGKDAGFDYDAFKNDISTNEEYNKEILITLTESKRVLITTPMRLTLD